MIPADFPERVRRWALTSTVETEGWVPDRAVVEYAAVDATTFRRLADIFNAAGPTDRLDLVVYVDEEPVTLFRGHVVDWQLRRRWERGRAETVGVLEAVDARGGLLGTFAASTRSWRGGASTRLSDVAAALGHEVGVTIETVSDRVLYQPVIPAGLHAGATLAAVLRGAQRIRSTRTDFVREGDRYLLRARRLSYASYGGTIVQVPRRICALLDYRRSRPRIPAHALEAPLSAQDEDGVALPPKWVVDGGTYLEIVPLPAGGGTLMHAYLNGRLTWERARRVVGASTVVDRTTYTYDTRARLTKIVSETELDGARVRRVERYLLIDFLSGRIQGEHEVQIEYDPSSQEEILRLVETIGKPETEAGVQKTLMRERIEGEVTTVLPRVREWSSGRISAEPAALAPPRQPDDDDRADAAAQDAHDLVELTLAMPLDPRIAAGTVLELTEEPEAPDDEPLVDLTRVYVTHVEMMWDREQDRSAHRMTVRGEAWTPSGFQAG
jgi:hypothetical protein